MRGYTHMMAGVCIGLVSVNNLQLDATNSTIVIGASIAGAFLPDICQPNSTIGRRIGIVSKTINRVFGHRTITHSLLFVFSITALSSILFSNTYFTKGLFLGMASHLLLDAFTTQGIKLFYPLSTKVRSPIYTKTGSLAENLLCTALLIVSCLIGYKMILNM